MNKIQQAMHNKANDAIGPIEHEIDTKAGVVILHIQTTTAF